MNLRADIAYLLIGLLAVAIVTVVVMTARYKRYVRRLARGHRHDRPVRKPFWLD